MAAYENISWTQRGSARVIGYSKVGITGDRSNPTPYKGQYGNSATYHRAVGTDPPPSGVWIDVPNGYGVNNTIAECPVAANSAYSDFVEMVRGDASADLLTFAGEGKEAVKMIASRLNDLIKTVKAVKGLARGRGVRAGRRKIIRGKAVVKRSEKALTKTRKGAGQLGSWWLEWSFGWAPTIGEIINVSQIFRRDFSWMDQITGKGFQEFFYKTNSLNTKRNQHAFSSVQLRGSARVVNPNKVLMDALGMTNPVASAAELVPFSFLADWAFDYSTWLRSYTDLFGYELDKVSCSVLTRSKANDWWRYTGPNGTNQVYIMQEFAGLRRTTGLYRPRPNLYLSANIGNSIKRIANAASLLASITSPR